MVLVISPQIHCSFCFFTQWHASYYKKMGQVCTLPARVSGTTVQMVRHIVRLGKYFRFAFLTLKQNSPNPSIIEIEETAFNDIDFVFFTGSCTVRWENKTIYCIVSVFGLAIWGWISCRPCRSPVQRLSLKNKQCCPCLMFNLNKFLCNSNSACVFLVRAILQKLLSPTAVSQSKNT